MSNPFRSSFFPESQQDIERLKQTATDAASDLSHTTATHATKVGENLRDSSEHAREESGVQIKQLAQQLDRLANTARTYAARRPLTCLGVAVGIGFLLGWSATRRTRDDQE